MVLSWVRLLRVRLVLVNLNPINDTYIPSEDREETVVLGERVSQPPVIGRWLIPPQEQLCAFF